MLKTLLTAIVEYVLKKKYRLWRATGATTSGVVAVIPMAV
jgi:hypothetical protein